MLDFANPDDVTLGEWQNLRIKTQVSKKISSSSLQLEIVCRDKNQKSPHNRHSTVQIIVYCVLVRTVSIECAELY